ncbi:MAG TPA: hypothetical protein VNF74_10600 [Terriglobales bacterium]|nr:hypothetical protein [Terriglobales bacterium]
MAAVEVLGGLHQGLACALAAVLGGYVQGNDVAAAAVVEGEDEAEQGAVLLQGYVKAARGGG